MSADKPGVATIFRHAGAAARRTGTFNAVALKVMNCIERCRTSALGGTVFKCTTCGHEHAVWKSCGNRHCPGCQGAAARKWREQQAACILPVPYFHLVFTLPRPIARIAMQNREQVFDILFRVTAETLRTISADPRRFGARIGGTAVLHSWNQKMEWHPHLHCLVPNGGFDVETGAWKAGSDRFFAPVKVLANYFRRRVLEELAKTHHQLAFHGAIADLADRRTFNRHLKQARKVNWNVYAKAPFNGPGAVIHYHSRYTHRVAISDTRILAFDGDTVTFRYRKPVSKTGDTPRYGSISLAAEAFIRRFLLHCLPTGFHRIRHFGILANGCRARTLNTVIPDHKEPGSKTTDDTEPKPRTCPVCGGETVVVLDETLYRQDADNPNSQPRGPPTTAAAPS